ncbi:MAG: hypothetical protein V4727_13900 [Verrucomicrobiota bacterium]
MHLSATTSYSLPLDIIGYLCLALLFAIFFLVLRINSKLSGVSNKASKPTSSASSSNDSEETEYNVEVAPGTPFEEFLNEDPSRRSLNKKEQFAAYRDWRSQKGLNWK